MLVNKVAAQGGASALGGRVCLGLGVEGSQGGLHLAQA